MSRIKNVQSLTSQLLYNLIIYIGYLVMINLISMIPPIRFVVQYLCYLLETSMFSDISNVVHVNTSRVELLL